MEALILLPLSASQCRPSPLGNDEASQKSASHVESRRDQDPHQILESFDGLGHVKNPSRLCHGERRASQQAQPVLEVGEIFS